MKISLDNNLEFLYQWDINRCLILTDFKAGTILQFTNSDIDNSLSVESKIKNDLVICNIPNILLTYDKDITAYVWDGEKVIFSKKIKVFPRNKPDDYIYSETNLLSITKLNEKINNLENNKADSLELIDNIFSLKAKDKILSSVELKTGLLDLENVVLTTDTLILDGGTT